MPANATNPEAVRQRSAKNPAQRGRRSATALGVFGALACLLGTACATSGPAALIAAKAPEEPEIRSVKQAFVAPESAPKAKTSLAEKDVPEEPVITAQDAMRELLQTFDRCPAEMALVDNRVCVDRWEASLLERARGSAEQPWSPFNAVDGHEGSVRAVSRPHVIPQAYISGEQAALACRASGKRLCTPREWESACRGPVRTAFPYGDSRRAGACNDDNRAVHPVVEIGSSLGLDPSTWWRDAMNNPLINQLPASLLRTAERVECTNAYGVFDMVGNLHEWVDDPDGTFRGGYYMDTSLNGDGCSYQTTAHNFRYHDYSTGFRCCMDPERVE